jgi:hypothetical protein
MIVRIRASRLVKYRYRAGAVMPRSRAMARKEMAVGPPATSRRRAASLISVTVSARSRSRRLDVVVVIAGSVDVGERCLRE